MNCLINTLYRRLRTISSSGHFGPLTSIDAVTLDHYNALLISVKVKKLTVLKFDALKEKSCPMVEPIKDFTKEDFTGDELDLLRKGPRYAPYPSRPGENQLVVLDAKIETAAGRLSNMVDKNSLMEFSATTKRIMRSSLHDPDMRKDALLKQLRERNVVYMTSDKSKKLVALPSSHYLSMFEEHKENLSEIKPVLPSTNQAMFNKRLSRIAKTNCC